MRDDAIQLPSPAYYRRLDEYRRRHHARYVTYVEQHGLLCQECGGSGQVFVDQIEYRPIYNDCGFCEGTGKVTRWMRGQWLRWKSQGKRERDVRRETLLVSNCPATT